MASIVLPANARSMPWTWILNPHFCEYYAPSSTWWAPAMAVAPAVAAALFAATGKRVRHIPIVAADVV